MNDNPQAQSAPDTFPGREPVHLGSVLDELFSSWEQPSETGRVLDDEVAR